MDWNSQVFLKIFNEKTEPDFKVLVKGEIKTKDGTETMTEIKTEDRIGVTTEQLIEATKEIQGKTLTSKQILQMYLYPLRNEGYIDRQVSNIHAKAYIYYPSGLESGSNNDGNRSFLSFLGRKRNEERENDNQKITDFTHEFSREYIKGEIEKLVAHSSKTSIFCEIFDHENNKIIVDELIEKYYFPPHSHPSDSVDTGTGTDMKNNGNNNDNNKHEKNSEKDGVLEEQATETKSSFVGQTEPVLIPFGSKIAEKERGMGDPKPPENGQNNTPFLCNYCNFQADSKADYEHHSANKHQRKPGYPDRNGRTQ